MSQDRFSIEESIQESLSFSYSLAKVAERARKMQKKQQPNIQSASYIEEDDFENKDDEVESGSIIEEIIGDSQIKSSIHISNTLGSSRAQKQSRHQSNSYGFGKDSSVNTYDQSMLQREEKNDFIDKKFNKLRKDIQYGPLSSIQNRMKTVQNKQLIDKIHQNQKQQQLNHEHYANKPCNFCENVLLKDLRFPQSKVDKLYMEEFLKMKYLKLVKDEGDEQREQMRQELKEYATEIERREVINRKFFQLKQKQIYGDDSSELDFNYSQK
eukprot:403345319